MDKKQLYSSFIEQLKPWIAVLGQASDTLINQGVSNYPIAVISNEDIELGIALSKEGEDVLRIKISTLEEFVSKRVIDSEKVNEFKNAYKDPEIYLCLAIFTIGENEIIFLPKDI